MFEKNKRAIVVGTSRGIGLGLVRELLNQHWHVIATIRDINQVSTGLNQLLSEYPDRFELTELNLNHVQTVDRLLSKYHERSIDLLLVSAGILGPEHQRVEQCTPNEIANLFWVNSIAPVTIARKLLPLMKEKSVIAFMSSRMGSVALNDDGSIITDNLNFHGLTKDVENIKSKNLKALVRKINNYKDFLKNNKEFTTEFYENGDGISVSKKIYKKQKNYDIIKNRKGV